MRADRLIHAAPPAGPRADDRPRTREGARKVRTFRVQRIVRSRYWPTACEVDVSGWTVTIGLVEVPDVASPYLLGFRPDLEFLDPPELRSKMAAAVQAMGALYGDRPSAADRAIVSRTLPRSQPR